MRIAQIALIFLLASAAFPTSVSTDEIPLTSAHDCISAKVFWRDAFIRVRAGGIDPDVLEQASYNTATWGCVSQTDHWLVIIHTFVEGVPQDYTIIPKQWGMKITKLEEVDETNQ